MKRAVLSLSGGLDSTCLLFYLLSKGYSVKAYSFKYGQRHLIELDKLKDNIVLLQDDGWSVEHQVIDLTDCFNESNSSLSVASSFKIPEGQYADDNMKSTVVENRNVIFASVIYGKALSWANKIDSLVDIFLGIHAGDHTIYPDCTSESQMALEQAFKVSNWGSEKVNYQAPFVNYDKAEVLNIGLEAIKEMGYDETMRDFILFHTHTCYNPNKKGEACGKCGSCQERLSAFEANRLKDPVVYQI